jgi:hypothetical protein
MDSPGFRNVNGYLGNILAVKIHSIPSNLGLNGPLQLQLPQHLVKSQAYNIYMHLCGLLHAKLACIHPVLGILWIFRDIHAIKS